MNILKPEGQLYSDLVEIFLSGLNRVNPYRMIINSLQCVNNNLIVQIDNQIKLKMDLGNFNKIFVFGTGKATSPMAKAVEEILGDRITGGVISVKYGYTENLSKIDIIEAGHPIPDDNSIKAAKAIISYKDKITEDTIVINLISGGGSSLLSYPFQGHIGNNNIQLTLEDIQETTGILLNSGATIDEINCIRKHISMIKGGKLVKFLYPAFQINLILSDVVGDRLDSIASGLTTWDNTTFKDALNILKKYRILEKIPRKVREIIESGTKGLIEETPKKGDKIFSKVRNFIVGSNFNALKSASKKSIELGYYTTIISSQIVGESREVAKVYAAISRDILKNSTLSSTPACVIGGGETTVTVRGNGKGGRNQEMALSFLNEVSKNPEDYKNIYFLSASTDGSDGPTDADGAFASLELLKKAKRQNLNPERFLDNNDSYNFFKKINGLFITGPTNTNVCDIQIVLVNRVKE